MSAPAPLRLATRRSALAMAQSRLVGEQLSAMTGRPLVLVEVTTQGDVDDGPLAQIGGTGVFVVAVRQALLDGRADVAVHSLKDLPTTPDRRLRLASVPRREDPRDALVARDGATLRTLVSGARVGTGSPRRRAQLAAARPDLELVDLRGNIDTRMARVPGASRVPGAGRESDDLDAVVLACAGLVRLGRQARISELFDPEVMMPAPGQGALAIEVRSEGSNDSASGLVQGQVGGGAQALDAALRALDDPHTRAAVVAERSLLATLEAGCSAPVGALAVIVDGDSPTILLRAVLATPDGSLLRVSDTGPLEQAELLGRRLADQLLIRAEEPTGSPPSWPGLAGPGTGPSPASRTDSGTASSAWSTASGSGPSIADSGAGPSTGRVRIPSTATSTAGRMAAPPGADPSPARTIPTSATGSNRATGPTSTHRGSTA